MPCCFDAKAECVVCILQIPYAFVQSERHNFQIYFGTMRRFNYLIFPLKSHSCIHSHAIQAIGSYSARDISISFYMQQGQCGKYRDKMVYLYPVKTSSKVFFFQKPENPFLSIGRIRPSLYGAHSQMACSSSTIFSQPFYRSSTSHDYPTRKKISKS